jgi:hypothetical protein
MPFSSEAQRRYLWKFHPDLAKKWSHEYPNSNKGLPYHKKHKKEGNTFLNGPLADLFDKEGRSRPDRYKQFNEMMSNASRHPDTQFGSIITPVRALYDSMGKEPHPALVTDSSDPQSARSNYSVKQAFKAGFLLRCAEEGLNLDQMEERIAKLEKQAGIGSSAGAILGWPVGVTAGLARLAGKGIAGGVTMPLAGSMYAGGLGGWALANASKKPEDVADPEDMKREDLRNEYLRLADEARRKTILRNMQQDEPGSVLQIG